MDGSNGSSLNAAVLRKTEALRTAEELLQKTTQDLAVSEEKVEVLQQKNRKLFMVKLLFLSHEVFFLSQVNRK
jgi:hypothetical protein